MALSHSGTRNPGRLTAEEPGGTGEPFRTLSIKPAVSGLTSGVTVPGLPKGAKLHTETRRRMRKLAIAVRNGESGAPEDG